jgi:hypothetical protein
MSSPSLLPVVNRFYTIAADLSWIRCLICGRRSHNANDVAQHYCAVCKRFLDDPPSEEKREGAK